MSVRKEKVENRMRMRMGMRTEWEWERNRMGMGMRMRMRMGTEQNGKENGKRAAKKFPSAQMQKVLNP
jgi:hypothetical protein